MKYKNRIRKKIICDGTMKPYLDFLNTIDLSKRRITRIELTPEEIILEEYDEKQ